MRKSTLLSLSVFVLAVFALSVTIASAVSESNKFVLSNITGVTKKSTPVNGEISGLVVKGNSKLKKNKRPIIKLVYSKLQNDATGKAGITATVEIHFKGTGSDLREVTMTVPVKFTVNEKGTQLTVGVPGGFGGYTGTNHIGTTVSGSLPVAADVFTGKAKTLSINSDKLIAALETKITEVSPEAGEYSFDITITGLTQEYKKIPFTKLLGTLTVK